MMKLVADIKIGNGHFYQFVLCTTPVLVRNYKVHDLDGRVLIGYPFTGGN